MIATVNFSDFICGVSETHGINCGAFNYQILPLNLNPDNPTIIKSISID